MQPVRKQYEQFGVAGYYADHADEYTNPHFQQVEALLIRNRERIDFRKILDLSCGHGEVSGVVQQLGYGDFVGSDPFTFEFYQQKLSAECKRWSFADIIKGEMTGEYSSVVCSFAMHLCPTDDLFLLVHQIFEHCSQLVIITPHKRPLLENLAGVALSCEDFSLTKRGKKVRLKVYEQKW
jgi:SAM-dependent methyltransferase